MALYAHRYLPSHNAIKHRPSQTEDALQLPRYFDTSQSSQSDDAHCVFIIYVYTYNDVVSLN